MTKRNTTANMSDGPDINLNQRSSERLRKIENLKKVMVNKRRDRLSLAQLKQDFKMAIAHFGLDVDPEFANLVKNNIPALWEIAETSLEGVFPTITLESLSWELQQSLDVPAIKSTNDNEFQDCENDLFKDRIDLNSRNDSSPPSLVIALHTQKSVERQISSGNQTNIPSPVYFDCD